MSTLKKIDIVRNTDGFTAIELLTVLSIGAIALSLVLAIYGPVNRYFAAQAVKNEFRQVAHMLKSVLEKQIRFAKQIEITNQGNRNTMPYGLFVNEHNQIVYLSEGVEQLLTDSEYLSFTLEFENHDPMLFLRVIGKSSDKDEQSFEMELLILQPKIYGISGSRLFFDL